MWQIFHNLELNYNLTVVPVCTYCSGMAKKAEIKTKRLEMRVDEKFIHSLGELQGYLRDPVAPPMSEVIRIAIDEALERRRKASKRKES